MPDFLFWNEVVIPLAGMGVGLFITFAIIRAVTKGLERRHEARMAAGGAGEVEGLRAEVGQLRSQVESLEERVDFTERMLTQERSRRQVESGGREK
ncbi:MAG: hypothetical protein HY700_10680 [Gemmatimonadetes bacterium]|nr:hypothetical protein [Gemmatimonadota bacterium]